MWKVLPLFLFAAVALLSYRYCSNTPDSERPSIAGITESPSPVASSIDSTSSDTVAMTREATARAMAALSGLTANSSPEDLIKALNLNVIDFSSDSTEIPADQAEVLKRSAEAIKAAPAGTRLEIGGHTDNQGEPAENLKISEARAKAVKEFLVKQGVSANSLSSKGYGDTKPVASNETAEGRFKNRRIEFSIVK